MYKVKGGGRKENEGGDTATEPVPGVVLIQKGDVPDHKSRVQNLAEYGEFKPFANPGVSAR
jgi:hypothetical protein